MAALHRLFERRRQVETVAVKLQSLKIEEIFREYGNDLEPAMDAGRTEERIRNRSSFNQYWKMSVMTSAEEHLQYQT